MAQYGLDAAMPKGSSIRNAEEIKRMDERERSQIQRLEKMRTYVYALEVAYDFFEDEQLQTIYECKAPSEFEGLLLCYCNETLTDTLAMKYLLRSSLVNCSIPLERIWRNTCFMFETL